MRPITCVVAADEPEIAAKMVQPITFTCSRRPGSSPAHGASPWNSDRDKLVRNNSSPIRMNSGSASSSCVVRMFQAYCGSSLSSGIERNIASSKRRGERERQADPQAARQQREQDREQG